MRLVSTPKIPEVDMEGRFMVFFHDFIYVYFLLILYLEVEMEGLVSRILLLHDTADVMHHGGDGALVRLGIV